MCKQDWRLIVQDIVQGGLFQEVLCQEIMFGDYIHEDSCWEIILGAYVYPEGGCWEDYVCGDLYKEST